MSSRLFAVFNRSSRYSELPLIGNGKLILQIHKTVIDRRGEEHQDFRLDAGADNLFHQLLIAVLLRVAVRADTVAEVMGFVNDDQVIVASVETV